MSLPAARSRPHPRAGRTDARRAVAGFLALPAVVALVWLATGHASATAAGSSGPVDSAPAGVSVAAVASVASGASGAAGGAQQAVTGSTASGEALYLQSCAACHGLQGAGTANAPSIANAGAALVDFVLRTGRMPLSAPNQPMTRKAPAFGDQQIADLVAYVASLGTGPAIPNVTTSGADIAQGRALFIQNCAACHGAGGAGGAVGGNVVAPALTQADPTTVGEAVTTGPGRMPVFRFSPQELDSLAAYVQALRNQPSPGGLAVAEIGPVAEGFLAGTIGVVTLLVVARWIARGRPEDDEAESQDAERDGERSVPGSTAGGSAPGAAS